MHLYHELFGDLDQDVKVKQWYSIEIPMSTHQQNLVIMGGLYN